MTDTTERNTKGTQSSSPIVLEKLIGKPSSPKESQKLRLALLACESNPPYGPGEHTGNLFLELLGRVLSENTSAIHLSIDVYSVENDEYPDQWDKYNGFLVTGSFSSAYESKEWISKLQAVIQQEIVSQKRQALAVCFGHQVMAHSFPTGRCIKNPLGKRAGRYAFNTQGCCNFFGKESIQLYYTHGDMVDQIPDCAVSLGGTQGLPIQAAAYFETSAQANEFRLHGPSPDLQPYAITLQAHPEYTASREKGMDMTFGRIVEDMNKRGDVTSQLQESIMEDSLLHFNSVQEDSLHAIKVACKALGWIPSK